MADEEDRPRRPRDDDDADADERPRRRRRDEEDDYDDADDRPRRRPDEGIDAASLIVPLNVNIYSLLACYIGLFSCILPFVGLLLGALALLFGVLAFKKRKKQREATFGQVTGDIRAVFGIVCGVLALIGNVILIVALALGG